LSSIQNTSIWEPRKKVFNQLAVSSRESESYRRLLPVPDQNPYIREEPPPSLPRAESPYAEQAIAKILIHMQEIAGGRESFSPVRQ
jgi:hypothetical protein